MKKPTLVVRTDRDGVHRVVVRYDAGDERAAFSLFERACGAIEELDRVIRSGPDPAHARESGR